MIYRPSNEQVEMLQTIINTPNPSFSFIAPAGCGKTSTILYIMDSLSADNKLLYLVFNTAMRKEIEQRLNWSNSPYNNINKENIEIYTLNGYMRKVLTARIPDVAFDFKNGNIAPIHLKTILDDIYANYSTDRYYINAGSASVTESFNDYIEPFLKDIEPLEDFISQPRQPYINEAIVSDLRNAIALKYNVKIDILSFEEKQSIIKSFFNDMMVSIFKDNVLNQSMPHSIYYRYVYENYKHENLFDGYSYIFVDEAQDVDLVITSLLDNSGIKVVKFGDDFQQINAFRGTINSLQDKKSVVRYLTMSYRLTPYLALVTSAYLKNQGSKLGIDKENIPEVYGYRREDTEPLSFQRIKELPSSDFLDVMIDDISKIKVEENDIYIDMMEEKTKIASSIVKGCTTKFKASVREFNKDRDYNKFLDAVMEYTEYLSAGGNLFNGTSSERDYKTLLSEEIKSSNKMGYVHSVLSKIAKAYLFKFSKKEKIELLQNSDYAYLAKNNNKVLDATYRFVEKIPFEPLSDFPLFNIKLRSTFVAKFDGIIKGSFDGLSTKEQAIFFQGMDSLMLPKINISVMKGLDRLGEIPIPELVIDTLIKHPHKANSLVERNIISGSYSLLDFGIDADSIRDNIQKAVTQTKKKTKLENPTAKDIIENGYLKSYKNFSKFNNVITNLFSLEEVENSFNPLILNFYKYSKIREFNLLNPNISIVSENGVSNICFSTAHQAKGLEFSTVFIGNDVYQQNESIEPNIEDEIADFNLAYVSMTRTKKRLYIESGSDLYPQIEEVLEKGYTRSFSSGKNSIIVDEVLSDNPSFIAKWQDSITKETRSKEITFFDKSIYPNYKNISVISNSDGVIVDIITSDDEMKPEYDGLTRSFLNPIKDNEKNEILSNWQEIQKKHNQNISALMKEAENVF